MVQNTEDMRAVRQSVRIAEGFCINRSVVFIYIEPWVTAAWDDIVCLANRHIYSYLFKSTECDYFEESALY